MHAPQRFTVGLIEIYQRHLSPLKGYRRIVAGAQVHSVATFCGCGLPGKTR